MDFIAVTKLKEKDLVAPAFLDRFTKTCTAAKPFMRYLTEACGLEWQGLTPLTLRCQRPAATANSGREPGDSENHD